MTTAKPPIIGVICAVPQEFGHFLALAGATPRETVAGMAFHGGAIAGTDCVLVEAGIGKVNTAVATTLLLERFGCGGVVFSGVAGGLDPTLHIGDVVVADRMAQYDYGLLVDERITPYQPGVPPLPGVDATHGYDMDRGLRSVLAEALNGVSPPPLTATASGGETRTPSISFGTILAGDAFLNCRTTRARLQVAFNAQAIEMEGAAIAQVAEKFGAPVVNIRCLSDLAGEGDSHMDFQAFVHDAAEIAASVVVRAVPALARWTMAG